MMAIVEPAGSLPAVLMVIAGGFVWLKRERLRMAHVLWLLLGAMLLYACVVLPLVYNFMVAPRLALSSDAMVFLMAMFGTLGMVSAFAMSVVLFLLKSGLAGTKEDGRA